MMGSGTQVTHLRCDARVELSVFGVGKMCALVRVDIDSIFYSFSVPFVSLFHSAKPTKVDLLPKVLHPTLDTTSRITASLPVRMFSVVIVGENCRPAKIAKTIVMSVSVDVIDYVVEPWGGVGLECFQHQYMDVPVSYPIAYS